MLITTARFACLLALGLTLSLGTGLSAQNLDHPHQVSLGDGKWGTPAEASALGLIEYRGRWFSKKLSKKLRKWERQDKKSKLWKDAYRTNSKHYRIQTNVPRFIVELEIKPFLDELYRTYVKVFREDFGLKGKAANKKFIRIYHGYPDYGKNEADSNGPMPRTTPGFILGDDQLVVFYEDTDPAEFYGTVFHEGAHQFFMAMLPGAALPVWLDEALATYFEGCTYSRATKKISLAYLHPGRLANAQEILAKTKDPSPEALFMTVDADNFDPEHYALAWSFVFYLIHRDDGRYKKLFARFLRGINGSGVKPVPEVFRKTTRQKLSTIQKGWAKFIMGLKSRKEPDWVYLRVALAEPDEDLKKGDRVWSLNGCEVTAAEQFRELWKKRPKDKASEIIVVRQIPLPRSTSYDTKFIKVLIKASSQIRLNTGLILSRTYGLVD